MELFTLWPFSKNPHSRFEALLSPHLKRLYRLAFRFTNQRDDAEDLVQDLLLKLYPRLEEMQQIDMLGPWLARVLYRLFIDKYRREQRSPIDPMNDEDSFYATHASHQSGPSEVANTVITQELINTALGKLSEEHRSLIMLHDVEGYSLQEINEITGTPEGTIKSRLSRARHKLRGLIHFRDTELSNGARADKG